MQLLIIVIAAVSVLLCTTGSAQEHIYTWKDKNGVLNITDYPPPPGADLLEISPSHREEAIRLLRQRQILQKKIEQYQREQERELQAARERKQQLEAQQEAAELLEQAEEMREGVSGDLQKRRRYERRAEKLEEKAQEIIMNPGLTDRDITDKKEEEPVRKSSGY